MGNILMIASCKGGVGKTTVAANISYELSASGKSVVALDLDLGIKSLDIALGMENIAGGNVVSLMEGRDSLENALCRNRFQNNLFLLNSPASFSEDDKERISPFLFEGLLKSLAMRFDYVILDMPAGKGRIFELAAKSGLVDTAIVVTGHSAASIRASEKTGSQLSAFGVKNIRLVINMFSPKKIQNGLYPGILQIIDLTSIPLLGVVPLDSKVEDFLQKGIPLRVAKKSSASSAFSNITKRLLGRSIPLLSGIIKLKKRKKLY